MLLLNKLVVLLESLRLSVPTTGFILTAPTAHKVSRLSAPGYKVAAAILPPTVVLVTWAVLSSHHDAPRPLPATTLQVANHDDLLHPVTFGPVCSIDSYDGPDEGLRRVTGRCDVPYFFESPKPIAAKPPILAWPTCTVAAYDGADVTLRRENGICDVQIPIFRPQLPTPQDTLDARTTHANLLVRALRSLPSDPHQAIANLSDRLHTLGCFPRVPWNSLLLDLDWPIVYTQFGEVGLTLHLVTVAVGASVSYIQSLNVQAFKHLFFGHEYFSLLAQVSLESTHQTSGLAVEFGCGFSGYLLCGVEQISLLCPLSESIEALHAKVDWIVILPLLHRLAQLFLALVLVISFYVGYWRLWVSRSFFNPVVAYIIY